MKISIDGKKEYDPNEITMVKVKKRIRHQLNQIKYDTGATSVGDVIEWLITESAKKGK